MLDFPNPPLTVGQTFNSGTGAIYVWDGVAWSIATSQTKTARSKNLLVNPNMQITQENGNSTVTTNTAYPADQWQLVFVGVVGSAARSQAYASPDNALNCISQWIGTVKPSLAAGDFCQIVQPIEGQRVADLAWGTAKAIPAVLRFNACADVAGTYTVSVGSGNSDYTWLGAFTCDGTSNMKTFAFAIPAQPAGTFPKDNTQGLNVHFCLAAGSTYVGVAGWQTGTKLAVPAQINGAAQANKGLIVTDVGLYVDPDNTGLPPPFIAPELADDLMRCMRYWEKQSQVLIIANTTLNQRSWLGSKRAQPSLGITFNSGTGATFAPTTVNGWYQSAAHSGAVQGDITGNARM